MSCAGGGICETYAPHFYSNGNVMLSTSYRLIVSGTKARKSSNRWLDRPIRALQRNRANLSDHSAPASSSDHSDSPIVPAPPERGRASSDYRAAPTKPRLERPFRAPKAASSGQLECLSGTEHARATNFERPSETERARAANSSSSEAERAGAANSSAPAGLSEPRAVTIAL